MELWDAYTRNGVKTGGVLVRGQKMWPGIYHLVIAVIRSAISKSDSDMRNKIDSLAQDERITITDTQSDLLASVIKIGESKIS